MMNNLPKRHKICLIAYGCKPGAGSEEGLGWGWTTGLSKYADIILITRKNNVSAIVNEIHARNNYAIKVIGVDLPAWTRFWKRGSRGAMLYHYFWQWLASKAATKLHKKNDFSLFHHLNFAVSWQPCWVASLGKSVMGPVDGAGMISFNYWTILGIKNCIKEIFRALIIFFGEKFDPFVRNNQRHCDAIIYRTKFIAGRFNHNLKRKLLIIPDTGLDDESVDYLLQLSRNKESQTEIRTITRVVFMGRFVGRKGVQFVIRAFAAAKETIKELELILIGDGPEKDRMKDLCYDLGILSSVRFTGRLERQNAWKILADGDLFLYPSLRDAVATVIIEAMAAGLPIICLKKTGPAQIVDHQTGILIEPECIKETVESLSNAIISLVKNPLLRKKMGQMAQIKVKKEHTWNARAKAMLKVYSGIGISIDEH